MNPVGEIRSIAVGRFRIRLLVIMMLVVSILTSLGIYLTQRRADEAAEKALQQDFQVQVSALHRLEELRQSTLAARSQTIAQNSRIHAALEDNALDLLYPSAQDDLRDLMHPSGPNKTFQARFYRFLDGHGQVITPPVGIDAGSLSVTEESHLTQPGLSQKMQTGYLARRLKSDTATIEEVIALPIRSTETNEVIAVLILGFDPVEAGDHNLMLGMKSGILVNQTLHLAGFNSATEVELRARVLPALDSSGRSANSLRTTISGQPYFVFAKVLNPESAYPPAYELYLYPLQPFQIQQRRLRWQILGAGSLLLLGGFFVSGFFSSRLSQPLEKLALTSAENFTLREKAEAKLQITTEELQRSARFSADASHQLKSPITVLRAGLDSLLARKGFPSEVYEELSSLIHQTYRLTTVVEDLLLLSRMDAGKLDLHLHSISLTKLIEDWLDDFQTLQESNEVAIDYRPSRELQVAGDPHYTAIIVHNVLDNARKYNRAGGSIRIETRHSPETVELHVANTGRGIPLGAQPYIFERFHRGPCAEVAGHGIGLNLARDLARLHGGDLILVKSDAEWTEFVILLLSRPNE